MEARLAKGQWGHVDCGSIAGCPGGAAECRQGFLARGVTERAKGLALRREESSITMIRLSFSNISHSRCLHDTPSVLAADQVDA